MSGNGSNGIDPRIKEAQRRLLKAQEPLSQLDEQIGKLHAQLATVNGAVARADHEHSAASIAYADDDSAANRKRLLAAAEEATVQRAKVQPLQQRIDRLVAQRDTLNMAVNQATTVLSEVTLDVRVQVLDAEMATHKFHIAQHETAIIERRKLFDAAKNEQRRLITQKDDVRWRRDKALALERARHNVSPEIITVRR